jgi:uncharacterized membrane protein YozB (DUF420 family)
VNFYLFLGTVSLAFQLAILALLIRGFGFKQHLKFRTHGLTMLIALAVHLITVGVVMLPSFVVGLVPKILEEPTSLVALSSIFMAALGTATVILAIWIVGSWRLRQSTKFCAPKKKFMRVTFILWLVSLSLGIILYFALNWSSLFG